MKSKILPFIGYEISGVADLTMWSGGNACIGMNSFQVTHLREIRKGINDAGCGVQSINGAICNIARIYGYGPLSGQYKEYCREVIIDNCSEETQNYFYDGGM